MSNTQSNMIKIRPGEYPDDGHSSLMYVFGKELKVRGFSIYGHSWLSMMDVAKLAAGKKHSDFLQDRLLRLTTPTMECRSVVLRPLQRVSRLRFMLCARTDMLIHVLDQLAHDRNWIRHRHDLEKTKNFLTAIFRGEEPMAASAKGTLETDRGPIVTLSRQPLLQDTKLMPPNLVVESEAMKQAGEGPGCGPSIPKEKQALPAWLHNIAPATPYRDPADEIPSVFRPHIPFRTTACSGEVYSYVSDSNSAVRCAIYKSLHLVSIQDIGVVCQFQNHGLMSRLLQLAGAQIFEVTKVNPKFLAMPASPPILMVETGQLRDLCLHKSTFSAAVASLCNRVSRYLESLSTQQLDKSVSDVRELELKLAETNKILVEQKKLIEQQEVRLQALSDSLKRGGENE